jgi:Leucine-rich repeat (LRR) protein
MSRKMVKVVKMDLSSKKLSSLSGMRSIDITQYPLKVKLSSNQFETVPTTELIGLDLRVLDMSKNIIQSLPESVSELQKLEVLNLAGNRLRNMGEEMLALTNLRILDLSGNQLASVPPVVSQMVCLEALRLTKNLLHVLPTTLTFLTNLQELEVSGNPLLSPPINVIHRGTTAILAHLETISNTIGAPINPFTPLLRPPYIAEWIKATPDCPTASRSHPKTLFPVR